MTSYRIRTEHGSIYFVVSVSEGPSTGAAKTAPAAAKGKVVKGKVNKEKLSTSSSSTMFNEDMPNWTLNVVSNGTAGVSQTWCCNIKLGHCIFTGVIVSGSIIVADLIITIIVLGQDVVSG